MKPQKHSTLDCKAESMSFSIPWRSVLFPQAEEDGGAREAGEGGQPVNNLVSKGLLDTESPLYRAAVRIQSRYRGYVIRKVRFSQFWPIHC